MSTFRERFEEALAMNNMTPAELSRKTGFSPSVISYYRSGRYEPKSKQLYSLAQALNVSILHIDPPFAIVDLGYQPLTHLKPPQTLNVSVPHLLV